MPRRDIEKLLKVSGFTLERQGKKHDLWRFDKHRVTLNRGDLPYRLEKLLRVQIRKILSGEPSGILLRTQLAHSDRVA